MTESERPTPYDETVARLEPGTVMIVRDASLTSIAISQRRAADALERIADALCRWGDGDDADTGKDAPKDG